MAGDSLMTTAQLAKTLKQKFPQLGSYPDDELIKKVVERRPELKSRLVSGAGGSWEVPTKVGEMPRADEVWEAVNKPFIPEGRAEAEGHKYASDSPIDMDHPVLQGIKAGLAGTYADTIETLRSFSSPLALGTIGLGKLTEAPGAAGKIFKALSALAKTGFTVQGVKQASKGDLSTPEGVRNLLQGSGQAILGARELPTELGKEVRITAQEGAGAGKEPVLQARIARDAAEKANAERHSEHVATIAEDNARKMQEHTAKVQEAKAAYDKEFNDYKAADASRKAAHAEKVNAARRDWVEKAHAAKKAKAEAAAAQSQTASIVKGQQAYSKIIKDNVDSTFNRVNSSLNSRWDALRDKVGANTPLNSVKIAEAIDQGRQMLQGAPADLKVFNDLMRQMETADTVDTPEGGTPALRPLGWQEGRTHYSALGDKLYSGELPGNVARAIKLVRDSTDSELHRVAQSKGQGPAYTQLKSDWHNFMQDWKDMGSLATGGSPLARVRAAKDSGFVSQAALGKAGERMAETLGKYSSFGGNAGAIARLRALSEKAKAIPRVKVPAAPGKFEAPAEPKPIAPPDRKPEPKPPTLRSAKPYKPVPPVDPVEIRRKRLLEVGGRPFGLWDMLPPVLLRHLMLKSPAIREWVATQERKELTPP